MKSHPKSASVISRVILLTGLLGVVLALVPAAPATAQDAPSKKSYDDLMREMYRLHEAKEYKDALRVAQEIHKLRPDDNRAMYNLACLHCLCGDHDEALSWLEKCVEAGFNDVKLLLEDSDLAAVRDTERYKRVVAKLRGDDKKEEPKPAATEETRAPRREGRRPAAETATDAAKKPESTPAAAPKTKLIVKSDYVVSVAEGHDASRAAPLIVALHGSRGNMRKFVDRWAAAAAAQGAVLLAPQGERHVTASEFDWQPGRGSEQRVLEAIGAVMKDYRIDEDRIVLVGFCRGADVAYRLLAENPKKFRGLIATAGIFDQRLRPTIEEKRCEGRRIFIMAGTEDNQWVRETSRLAQDVFRAAGATVKLKELPRTGHAYPKDVSAVQSEALAYVFGV
ncbi:MAG: dienelactone hydrolase family protein [Phycisphaerae bacterium]|nr:dienelactone hydrolase family protein [Phycisphaerae bacterium]NUQ44449.1 dienelactone hydrolase family protein [Phycisphaerae bacterium]